jgi:hypothetical protein
VTAQASIDVVDERVRQMIAEDWDYEHDDQYIGGELRNAAVCYAVQGRNPYDQGEVPMRWPWGDDDWKPKSYRENLVRAAALLIAEIERIDRCIKT